MSIHHCDLKIIREPIVYKNEIVNSELADNLLTTIASHKQQFGPLYQNYSAERLDLAGHLAFDVLLDESTGSIVAGCGAYNGGRYPSGVYRVLNRSFVMPSYRSASTFQLLNTQYILRNQLIENSDEIETAFVSREGPDGHRFLNWWAKKYAEFFPECETWNLSKEFFHVAPKSNKKSAYHQIAWYQKRQGELTWSPLSLNKAQWSHQEA